MNLWALVVAGFVSTAGPVTEFAGVFKSPEQCEQARQELAKLESPKEVKAVGVGCIKLETPKGKQT